MEYVKLTLVLQIAVIRCTISDEYKNIDAVCGGFLLKTRNYFFNEFIAESVGKYRYPVIHYPVPRQLRMPVDHTTYKHYIPACYEMQLTFCVYSAMHMITKI